MLNGLKVHKYLALIILLVGCTFLLLQNTVFAAADALTLQMYNGNTSSNTGEINPGFKLINKGITQIDLTKVTIRYFFTEENHNKGKRLNFNIQNARGSFVDMPVPTTDANAYLEISFTSGTLKPGESLVFTANFTHNGNYKKDFNQLNDYSFNQNSTSENYSDWNKVIVIYEDTQLWGNAPGSVVPAAPINLTATPGNNTVALTWTASAQATGYNIKRSTTSEGPYTTIAKTAATNYSDTGLTNGTIYYYKVSATTGKSESADSNVVSAKPANPTNPGTGFTGTYYDNMDFTNLKLTRIDPTINFSWVFAPPHSSMESDTYSVRWTGSIMPAFSERYTFWLTYTCGGVRLWVDGKLVIDRWSDQWFDIALGSLELVKGQKYDIKVEYYMNQGIGGVSFLWSSESLGFEIVPQDSVYPPGAEPVIPTFMSMWHKVQTTDGNSYLFGDYSPMALKVKVQKAISNPVLGIDLNIKKNDYSSNSGFLMDKLTVKNEAGNTVLDKSSIEVLVDGVKLSSDNIDTSVDTTQGWLKFRILSSLAKDNEVEVRYVTKVSASDDVINCGIKKYLTDNALDNMNLKVNYKIFEWVSAGTTVTDGYSRDAANVSEVEKLTFSADIKIEDSGKLQ